MPTPQQLQLAQDAQERVRAYNQMLRRRNMLSRDLAVLGPEGQQAMQEYQYSQVAPETAEFASMNFPDPAVPEAPLRADYDVNKYGQVSFDMEVDQQAVDQTFAQRFPIEMQAAERFRPDLPPSQVPEHAMNRIIERTGWYPSEDWMQNNIPNWKDRRNIDFYSIANKLERDPEFREGISALKPGMQGQALDNLVNIAANIAAKNAMNGYMPDSVREYIQGATKLAENGLGRYLADMGETPQTATPEQRAQAAEQMLLDHMEKSMMGTIGSETGRQSRVPYEPIAGKDALKIGTDPSQVPGGTYYGLAQQTGGARVPSNTEIQARQNLYVVQRKIENLGSMLLGGAGYPGIFEDVGPSLPGRIWGRITGYGDQARGTPRGQAIQVYKSNLAYLARQLLQIAGEKGSRFSDQDVKGILEMAPVIDFLTMDSEPVTRAKMDMIYSGLANLITAQETGVYYKDLPQTKEWMAKMQELRGQLGDDFEPNPVADITLESQAPDPKVESALDALRKKAKK